MFVTRRVGRIVYNGYMSKRWKFRPKRREILLGATALSFGVFMTLIATNVVSRLESGSIALSPGNGTAEGRLTTAWLPETVTRWRPAIEKYATKYHVDPNLIAIIMTVESGGDPHASSGVAKGLMQVTDPTAGDIAHRILKEKRATYDLYEPDTSIEFGAAYIRYLTDQLGDVSQGPSWDETVILVSAGYNGGLAASRAYRLHGWQGLADYDTQTLNYARYVHVMWAERHDPLSFSYRYWHDAANGSHLIEQASKYKIQ